MCLLPEKGVKRLPGILGICAYRIYMLVLGLNHCMWEGVARRTYPQLAHGFLQVFLVNCHPEASQQEWHFLFVCLAFVKSTNLGLKSGDIIWNMEQKRWKKRDLYGFVCCFFSSELEKHEKTFGILDTQRFREKRCFAKGGAVEKGRSNLACLGPQILVHFGSRYRSLMKWNAGV